MKGSEFVYDSVDLLHYKFHRISLNKQRWILYKFKEKKEGNNKS